MRMAALHILVALLVTQLFVAVSFGCTVSGIPVTCDFAGNVVWNSTVRVSLPTLRLAPSSLMTFIVDPLLRPSGSFMLDVESDTFLAGGVVIELASHPPSAYQIKVKQVALGVNLLNCTQLVNARNFVTGSFGSVVVVQNYPNTCAGSMEIQTKYLPTTSVTSGGVEVTITVPLCAKVSVAAVVVPVLASLGGIALVATGVVLFLRRKNKADSVTSAVVPAAVPSTTAVGSSNDLE